MYDTAGQLTSTTNPQGTTHFGYDAAGNRTSATDPAGNTVTIGYDRMHRVTSLTYPDATPAVAYTYDSDGNRTSMTDGAGTVTYSADSLGRLTAVSRGGDTFSYGYDVAGNLTSRTFPGQAADAFSYDDDGRLASLATGTTTVASYSYDADSHLTQASLANGIAQTRTWDPAGRLTDITSAHGATAVARASYTYDATANPTQMVDAAGATTTYGYDSIDRLTEACFASTTCASATDYVRWTYDDIGHRLTEVRPAGTTTSTYNSKDQLAQTSGPSGTTTFTYDDNGNQTQAGATTFAYNTAGRMTSQTTGATTTSYTYDGDGRRQAATTGATTVGFLWDPLTYQLALERDGSASLVRRYTYGAGLTAMTTGGGATSYYLPDGQGSTLAVTDSAGATQWTYRWEPYGLSKSTTKVDSNAPDNPRQWLGEYAETGQVHLRARQYDPATGQFTSPDQGGSGDAYGYAGANPLVFTDPFGLDPRDTVNTINQVAADTAMIAGTAAVACAAIVICAPLDGILGPIAITAGLVSAGIGIGLAIDGCTSHKGSCAEAIVGAAIGAAAIVPGGGDLAKAGRELEAAVGSAGDEAFHYTAAQFAKSIETTGLRSGTYATPNGSLSPLQATLELALPPNRGLPGAVIQIDVAGLRQAGYEIPEITRVSSTVTADGRTYTMPGGGYEMKFPYRVPPEFIKVVG